jgi:hypothetical protein
MELTYFLTKIIFFLSSEGFLFFAALTAFFAVVFGIILLITFLINKSALETTISKEKVLKGKEKLKMLMAQLFVNSLDKNNSSFKNRLSYLSRQSSIDDWKKILDGKTQNLKKPQTVESEDYRAIAFYDIYLYYSLRIFSKAFDILFDSSNLFDFTKDARNAKKLEQLCDADINEFILDEFQWMQDIFAELLIIASLPPTKKQIFIYSQTFLLAQYLEFSGVRPVYPPPIQFALLGLTQAVVDAEVSGLDVFSPDVQLPESWEQLIREVLESIQDEIRDNPLQIEVVRLNSILAGEVVETSNEETSFYAAESKEDLSQLFDQLGIKHEIQQVGGEYVFKTNLPSSVTGRLVTSIAAMQFKDVSVSTQQKNEDGDWVETQPKELIVDIVERNKETLKAIQAKRLETEKKNREITLDPELTVSTDLWVTFTSNTNDEIPNLVKFSKALNLFNNHLELSESKEIDVDLDQMVYWFRFPNRTVEVAFVECLLDTVTDIEGIDSNIQGLEDIDGNSLLLSALFVLRESPTGGYSELEIEALLNPSDEKINFSLYQPLYKYLDKLIESRNQNKSIELPQPSIGQGKEKMDFNYIVLTTGNSENKLDTICYQDVIYFYNLAFSYGIKAKAVYTKEGIYIIFFTHQDNFSLAVIEAKINQTFNSCAESMLNNLYIARGSMCNRGDKQFIQTMNSQVLPTLDYNKFRRP